MAPPPRRVMNPRFKPGVVQSKPTPVEAANRPPSEYLTSLLDPAKVTRLSLPHGCFNAGIAPLPTSGGYVCVYRPDERSFAACLLGDDLQIIPGSTRQLGLTNCADPRLIWWRGSLLMVYSSHDTGSFKTECIRAAVIAESHGYFQWVQAEPFRISLPGESRQKNWTPFIGPGDRLYLVATVRPHLIYELCEIGRFAEPVCETEWNSPWFYGSEFLRGNTPPVDLGNGTFLGTFHTAVKLTSKLHFYDNGCYVFDGKPPFRVLRCGRRAYLPAEAAIEPHFRKAGLIKVCFPVGAVRNADRLLISYGDNDSSVKIMETTVSAMLATTIELY